MALRVVPEGLAAASASIEALTARMAGAHAAALPLITAVLPPAADPVSVQSAAAFSARGGEHAVAAAEGTEELGRAGVGVGESGVGYVSGDVAAAAAYGVLGS
ncbi:type VII secretion system ESX-3 target PE5 [Mycobacterium cookii]|uniref:PE family immunomodulator PE5 n=1 Tax=Mycobacterium cookii TaxID=1775 RepID=A0A7I7KT14_9MYCO|nr:PE family protein [Mycobacterium cookii]MCV7332496.1 PE family protein [Mycobacterium cookii]BBX44482.1 PE family immunomodulator PE5 [Mycobacterium cookii]